MKKYFFLLLIISCQGVFGKTPGYMGKRLLIYYGATGMPMVSAFFTNEKVLDFNIKQQVGIEYILTRRREIGFSAELINDYITFHDDEGYYAGSTLAIIYGPSFFINTKNFWFNSRGSIAPVGWYSCSGLGFNKVAITDNGKYFPSGKTDLGVYRTGIYTFGFGKETVLWDRITIDGGARFGIAFAGLQTQLKREDTYGTDEISRKTTSKIFANYLFNLHFTIGLLIK